MNNVKIVLLVYGTIYLLPLLMLFVWSLIRKLGGAGPNHGAFSANGLRRARVLHDSLTLIAYVVVVYLILAYKNGDYFKAGTIAFALYLFASFLWGDLPFQKPKDPLR